MQIWPQPDARRDAADGGAQPAGAVRPRPVLIVDDDPVSRSVIEMRLDVLRLVNPRVTARDGDEAIDVPTRWVADGDPLPALVLLDGQMPGTSELGVLAWMRDHPGLRDIPVVLLAGDSDRDAIRAAYAAGATCYLVKPVGFSALADVLRGLEAPWALT